MKKTIPALLIMLTMLSCLLFSTPPVGETKFPLKQVLTIPADEEIQKIAVADDWIAVCTLNKIIAIDIASQKTLWSINISLDPFMHGCQIVDDSVVAGSYDQIVMISKSGNKKEIKLDAGEKNVIQLVAVYPRYLYVIRGPGWTFEVYDISKNTLLWKMSSNRGGTSAFYDVSNDIVYIASIGFIRAFDNSSGELLWTEDGHDVMASTFENDFLYVYEELSGRDKYRFSAIDLGTQSLLWSKDAVFTPASGVNKLTIIDNMLVASAGDLIAMDKSTGEQIWRAEVGESFYTMPVEFNDVIYAKSYASRTVFAFSSSDGEVIGFANLDLEDDGPFNTADVISGVYKINDGVVFNTKDKIVIYKIK